MSFVAVMPSVWPPYTEACLAGMSQRLAAFLLLVDNTDTNLGLAASWNLGRRAALDASLDWLVLVSAATRFGPAGGADFVDLLATYRGRAWVLESAAPVNQHLFAMSAAALEAMGPFDENYYPNYGCDADFCRRVHVLQAEGVGLPWANEPIDAWIAMAGHATKLAGVKVDHEQVWKYHVQKWNGRSGHETFTRPFGDPSLPISFWPTPPDPRSLIGTRPGEPPWDPASR